MKTSLITAVLMLVTAGTALAGSDSHPHSRRTVVLRQPPRPEPIFREQPHWQVARGKSVRVEWNGRWYHAKVMRRKGNAYLVHYVGWSSMWDEWVRPHRIRF